MLDILEFLDELLLGCTAGAGSLRDRALIDHDRKSKAGMLFRLSHHQLRGLVNGIARTVPVDDHAINAPADHVCDLAVHLGRVVGTVADIDVPRVAPPEHQVGVDPGRRARIEQRMHIHFADVSCSPITV